MSIREHIENFLHRHDLQGTAPPIPYSSKPQANSPSQPPSIPPKPYWHPRFDPSIAVNQYFQHELGDHGWGNNELENYVSSPSNSFHTSSNALVIRAIIASARDRDKYTSARLLSHQRLSRRCGYLEARITAPSASGIWPAFWLLPEEPFSWPTDGEVDIMEAWNGERKNHSCLHWGQHNGEDWDKHRVVVTPLQDLDHPAGHVYGFAWDQPQYRSREGGRMVWYIDGRPVMKAWKPKGTRRFEEWRILLNVAVGGNVCNGRVPADGCYDLVVHDIGLYEEPHGGWQRFEHDFKHTNEGRPNG